METGRVFHGYVKQGRGYAVPEMSAPGKLEAIRQLTGLSVIPGTLNVRLTEPFDLSRLDYVSFDAMGWTFDLSRQGIEFDGELGMYYGRVTVAETYPAAIIFFTWVSDIRTSAELICGYHLRTELNLGDEDMIEIRYIPPQ